MLEATANPPLLHIELAASAATWEEAQANAESANEALAGRTGEEKTRFALKIIPWENVALLFNQIEPVVVAAEPDPVLRAESSAPTLNVLLLRAALGWVGASIAERVTPAGARDRHASTIRDHRTTTTHRRAARPA